jgi:hypothetical protein
MDGWMDFSMDDSVVAFCGMVKLLPIMLGKVSDELDNDAPNRNGHW